MKLKKVLKDIPVVEVKGSKEVEITGVCSNSKLISPGNLFIAKKGNSLDGALFISEAISAGAIAVLTDLYDPSLKITQIIHPDVHAIEPLIAAQFNHFPSESLFMVGITGTNGKTTTAYLIKHLLDTFRGPCGLIGTIEYLIGNQTYQASRTTPDVSTNQKLLREMIHNECRSAVMEVTSHALEQRRVDQIDYDVAIFTNLTEDHLDYHQTMENYCSAKLKLFKALRREKHAKKNFPQAAIINKDDSWHEKIIQGCTAEIISYGINHVADLQAFDILFSARGTQFSLRYRQKTFRVQMPLIGRYNVYNCLAALGCGISQGFPIDELIAAASTFPPVPARLEPVSNPLELKIYVDFAHSPDALKNVLMCLQEFNKGKIITVFGCGGDRDKLKRPMMAKICEEYSDCCIVTSDNPRSEDPAVILQDILKGFSNQKSFVCELDRRKAIEMAIDMASPEDIVLIAGKGHETYQIFAHHTVEFDDRVIVREYCNKLEFKV